MRCGVVAWLGRTVGWTERKQLCRALIWSWSPSKCTPCCVTVAVSSNSPLTQALHHGQSPLPQLPGWLHGPGRPGAAQRHVCVRSAPLLCGGAVGTGHGGAGKRESKGLGGVGRSGGLAGDTSMATCCLYLPKPCTSVHLHGACMLPRPAAAGGPRERPLQRGPQAVAVWQQGRRLPALAVQVGREWPGLLLRSLRRLGPGGWGRMAIQQRRRRAGSMGEFSPLTSILHVALSCAWALRSLHRCLPLTQPH